MQELVSFMYDRIDDDMAHLERLMEQGELRPGAMSGTPMEINRVLADHRAKLAILQEHVRELQVVAHGHASDWTMGGQAARETVLRHLAQAYAGHPEYDEAWRP